VHLALGELQPLVGGELDLRWRTIGLPKRDAQGEPEPEPLEIRIGAARIGNATFVFLPGEPFVEGSTTNRVRGSLLESSDEFKLC
jgi:hypothetical protein